MRLNVDRTDDRIYARRMKLYWPFSQNQVFGLGLLLYSRAHLDHTGPTLDMDALARHAQDAEYSVAIVVKFYWKTAISTPKLL